MLTCHKTQRRYKRETIDGYRTNIVFIWADYYGDIELRAETYSPDGYLLPQYSQSTITDCDFMEKIDLSVVWERY